MRKFPELNALEQSTLMTTTFLGYDHNLVVADGAMYDMRNMTGDLTPLLAVRGRRGKVAEIPAPHGLAAKDTLLWISGTEVYMGGLKVEGVTLSEATNMLPKQLVSMGVYLCIWPDKVYINTQDLTDVGRMDAGFTSVASYTVSMCRGDGTDYDMSAIARSDTAPDAPENGDMWIDQSGETHVLMQYSEATAEWVQVATTFIKLQSVGLGAAFSQYDGVEVSGIHADDAESGLPEAVTAQLEALNGSMLLYEAGTDYVVIAGFIDQAVTITESMVNIRRVVPDMDYITECNNRLWGCKYGMVDGQVVNEIYASKLGDFKNWRSFLGISTDSYTASVGTDGIFTGAATVAGNPVFFKEWCLHKVTGLGGTAFQITTLACRGVQEGCAASLCTVNEVLFYRSRSGIMTYDGSLPSSVSAALGPEAYYDAVAGAAGEKYYISMRDGSGRWGLFVFSTKTGMWHREDETHALAFASRGDELYYINAQGQLMAERGTEGTPEEPVGWMAETGVFGYSYENHKYLSRFNIRAQMEAGAEMKLEIQYDSDGVWREMGTMKGTTTQTFMVPVIPRRCDHCRLRLSGTGQVKVFSLARILEIGGDG